uniref:Disease resistance R13L4/SHOC-2-like LRR domain-containing protein n=1 Tax=Vannella robusta TaxID=1487602 RepID=A0A7S4IJN8_9EUKA|mmetsp:Transcript_3385/g.4210  ORF Transcript_3385/g.4210 Transcript_3385/m.4210 type:complete len:349 (+) Transcript_3385:59-1105(+)
MWQRSVQELLDSWKKNPDVELRLERLRLTELPGELFDLQIPIARLSFALNNLQTLPMDLADAQPGLVELELMGNDFHHNQDNSAMYSVISRFNHLEKLSVSENKLSDPDELIRTLLSMKSVTKLLAFSFPMGVHVGQCLSHISEMKQLTCLDLSVCNIHGFPSMLEKLANLTSLDLSYNRFCTVPKEIGNFKELTQLSLNGCSISYISEGLVELDKLEHLRLAFNELSSLPDNMKQMKNLRSVVLSNNNFVELPSCIFDIETKQSLLPVLESFQIQGNLLDFGDSQESLKFGIASVSATPSRLLQRPSLVIDSEEIMGDLKNPVQLHEVYLGYFNYFTSCVSRPMKVL